MRWKGARERVDHLHIESRVERGRERDHWTCPEGDGGGVGYRDGHDAWRSLQEAGYKREEEEEKALLFRARHGSVQAPFNLYMQRYRDEEIEVDGVGICSADVRRFAFPFSSLS